MSALDFDEDELVMLRQLFRDEAREALEVVTARALAAGPTPPSGEALAEMMRVTHTTPAPRRIAPRPRRRPSVP